MCSTSQFSSATSGTSSGNLIPDILPVVEFWRSFDEVVTRTQQDDTAEQVGLP
jgi:hypothetical protein